MTSGVDETREDVRRLFAGFTDREVVPVASSRDAEGRFPMDLFRRVGELGFFGMIHPESEGGSDQDVGTLCAAAEELARGWMSLAASATMQALMGTWFLRRSESAEVRERFLRPAIRGDVIATLCMTEPDAGSDLMSIATRAVRDGDDYVISGAKTWITNAPVADVLTVFAQAPGGLSVFIVEAKAGGVRLGRPIEKMGVRCSPTSEVSLESVRVPVSRRVGAEGQGAASLPEILPRIRTVTAALALGTARAAFECARRYAGERRQFGRPIAEFQAVRMRLADMATDLFAAERTLRGTADLLDAGGATAGHAAMCKNFVTEAALRVCDGAARILASYGFASDYPVERCLRDVRFTLIGGGTPEILNLAIAKEFA